MIIIILYRFVNVPSVWAKRKLWDQNGASHNSKTATPHSIKIQWELHITIVQFPLKKIFFWLFSFWVVWCPDWLRKGICPMSSFMSCCDKKFRSLPVETTSAHQVVLKLMHRLTFMEVSWFLQIFLRFPLKRTFFFPEVAPSMFCPFNYTKMIST